jgi:hypothetical protein
MAKITSTLPSRRRASLWHLDTDRSTPDSSGYEAANFKVPKNARDCHVHVFDPDRFPTPKREPIPRTNHLFSTRETEIQKLRSLKPHQTANKSIEQGNTRANK